MRKRFDVVIHGATGVTGRRATTHLSQRTPHGRLRWAVSGRNGAALGHLAGAPESIVVDSTDPTTVDELAASAKVVVNFAGPYAPHGDTLVDACVRNRTHYVDLCGEKDVIRSRIDRLHASATDAGVVVLPACGYESVPFDLAVGLLDDWAESRLATLERVSVEVTFELRGRARFGSGTSGGTFATLLQHTTDPMLTNPLALTDHPDPVVAEDPLRPRRSQNGDWLAPLMPDPFLNIAVIQRSRQLNGARPLPYEEGLNTTAMIGSAVGGRLAAHAIAWPMTRIAALSTGRRRLGDRAVRFALDKLAPRPGRGPSDRALDQFDYQLQVVGAAKDATRRILITAHGNPGYRSSPDLAVEAALSLLDRRDGVGGVLTPSTADLGDSTSLLERCGMSLAWDRTSPTPRRT